MSYINEALRKAQKEKEAFSIKYGGFLSSRKDGRKALISRPLWWTSLVLVPILFAFVLYLWLGSRGTDTISASKVPGPIVVSVQKPILNAKDLYDRARGFQKSGHLKEAIRLYRKAIVLDRGNVYALNNLGVIFIQEGNYAEARKSLENAVRIKPEYVDPYYNLACLYAIEGDAKKGLDWLKRAILLNESVREWAQKDKDLQGLRALPGFKEIIKIVK